MDDVVKDWGDENAVKAENGAEADRITNVEGAGSRAAETIQACQLRKLKYFICCLIDIFLFSSLTSLKQHIEYFHFRCKIMMDHPVKSARGLR